MFTKSQKSSFYFFFFFSFFYALRLLLKYNFQHLKDELFLKEVAQTQSHIRFALIILFHPIYEYI